jgi:predicted nucleotidyltransferase
VARPELRALGYFGSYARGDWGVGSDLDIVAVVATTDVPFDRRALHWDLSTLPVPVDLLV